MPPDRSRSSRIIRSSAGCAISTRGGSRRRDGSYTTRRSARYCSAGRRKSSSERRTSTMPAQSLNHYTIRVRDLESTKNFYTDVVGLKVGDRPPLAFPGYWLYCGDVPTVHLIGYRADDAPIDDAPSDPAKTGR